MKYLVYCGLIVFGLLYHISTSEFWPITISKTWLRSESFEWSVLQKPLFSLLLALFHLFPLTDVSHLLAVKLVFAVSGLAGVCFFAEFLIEFTGRSAKQLRVWILLALLVMSPVLLQNFFRVRTDQVCFMLFSLALLLNQRKSYLKSIAIWLTIPLVSIKGLMFFVPAAFILFPHYRIYLKQLKSVHKTYLLLSGFAVLIWVLKFNLQSFLYLIQTFNSMGFPNSYLKRLFHFEGLLVLASAALSVRAIYQNDLRLKPFAYASLSSLTLVLLFPQSYPYFNASFAPLIYLPLFLRILQHPEFPRLRSTYPVLVQVVIVILNCFYFKNHVFYPNLAQLDYIEKSAAIVEKHSLMYLDGIGILPRQKFAPCFVSPDDEISNESCMKMMSEHSADTIIVTNRLNHLGLPLYEILEKSYVQVLPGFWLRNNLTALIAEYRTDLSKSVPAMFIFGFE